MNRISHFVLVFLLASTKVVALDFVCPNKIMTSQKVLEFNAGWDQFVRPEDEKEQSWSPVAGISIYSGHPGEMYELVPDNGEDVWTFRAPATPAQPTYMTCSYYRTRLELIKPLPLNIKKCITNKSQRGILHCELFKT